MLTRIKVSSGVFAIATCLASTGVAGETSMARQHVEHMATPEKPARMIAGSDATLLRHAAGVTMTMATSELMPGHVTTAWWVIMMRPENCSQTPCTPDDVIGRAEEVGTQIVYADGVVNGPGGRARFAAFLPVDAVDGGWYPQSFDAPHTAEIHLVLNDHGPLVPEISASMLTSYRGGCRTESLPPPFPETAKKNGIPGPNDCRLIQDAIFVPTPDASN